MIVNNNIILYLSKTIFGFSNNFSVMCELDNLDKNKDKNYCPNGDVMQTPNNKILYIKQTSEKPRIMYIDTLVQLCIS